MNKYIKLAVAGIIGAVAGYAYYYFIGCNSGSCPISSNWHISTLYGLGAGLLVGFPSRKKQDNKS